MALKFRMLQRCYSLKAGDTVKVTRLITLEEVKQFTSLTGDSNRVHSKVVHGAFLNALLSSVIGTRLPGHGTLVVHQTLRFPKPCFIGEEVTISVEVVSVRKLVEVDYYVSVNDGLKDMRRVLEGRAKLAIPKDENNFDQ